MVIPISRRAFSTRVAVSSFALWEGPRAESRELRFQEVETGSWPVSDPANAMIDPSLPATLDAILPEYPAVTGVVVIRSGAIVFEHYQGAYGRNDVLDIRSVTKSVVGTLIGISLHRGELPGLDATIGELIPARIPADADPGVASITIRSLLTMTSGLEWDHHTDYERLEASDDPVKTTLSQPIVAEQGTAYVYNSGGSHLLGVMLEAVSGRKLEDYADDVLFQRLGIERGPWRTSPQGEAIGGYGLRLTPRDMARLGQLYLNRGAWNGAAVLSAEYVDAATTVQSSGDGTGGTPYGYQWWVTDASGHDAFFALGYGGQYVYVVPALELVCVIAVGYENDLLELRSPRPIIENVIIPAVQR